jgi:hypothetical protein
MALPILFIVTGLFFIVAWLMKWTWVLSFIRLGWWIGPWDMYGKLLSKKQQEKRLRWYALAGVMILLMGCYFAVMIWKANT